MERRLHGFFSFEHSFQSHVPSLIYHVPSLIYHVPFLIVFIMFSESKDECATTITSNMSEMGIESAVAVDGMTMKKQKSFSRGELLSEAYKDLLSVRSTFISSFAQMRHALAKSRYG